MYTPIESPGLIICSSGEAEVVKWILCLVEVNLLVKKFKKKFLLRFA